MEPWLFSTVTAAARAIAYIGTPEVTERELSPPHPAFVGFRRTSYVWVEGNELHPLGGLRL